MQHKCTTWRNLQGDPVFSIYLTCSQHIVHGMTAENSNPNPHGYKRQPTFQRDDMNRQEESKLYGVFIDQSRKYLNNEILAMKVLLKIIYFFKIFVLPRLNQDPRTTQKKKETSAIKKQLSYPLSSVLPGHNAHDLQLLGLAASLELHPRTTGATETPPIGFEKGNPKNTETLKSCSLSKGKRTMGV